MNKTYKPQIRELTMLYGLTYPSTDELIMLILGSGSKTKPIETLAKEVQSVILASNTETLVQNLMSVKGMGQNKALCIAAALELGRRVTRQPQAIVSSPSDVIPYIQSYTMQPMEHFLCITMNGAREILSIRVVCVGSGNMAILRPAEIFAEAVKEHASAIILSHNHPSGNPEPSEPDIKTTYSLSKAAEVLGIALLDHIIIAKNGYYSFLEHNLLENSDEKKK